MLRSTLMPMVSKSKETPVKLTEQHITLRKIADNLLAMLLHLIRMEIGTTQAKMGKHLQVNKLLTIYHSTFTLMVSKLKMPLSSQMEIPIIFKKIVAKWFVTVFGQMTMETGTIAIKKENLSQANSLQMASICISTQTVFRLRVKSLQQVSNPITSIRIVVIRS